MQKLKPCPFCGSLPDHFGYTHEWVVLCNCAAKPRVDEKTEEAALEAWNDRDTERESGTDMAAFREAFDNMPEEIKRVPHYGWFVDLYEAAKQRRKS